MTRKHKSSQRSRRRLLNYPLAATTFFFAIFNVQIFSLIIPLLIMAVTGLCALKFHRELVGYGAELKVVLIFPAIVMLSATWSDVPTISLWYGIQLLVTIFVGILIGICATSREIVRGIYYAMAIVVIASLISGQTGPSAAGPVLIGITGSKDAMGFVGLTLFAAALGVATDAGQPTFSRLSTLVFLPLGAGIAAGVEALSSALAAVGFALAFLGFLTLKRFDRWSRWTFVVIGLIAVMFAALALAGTGFSSDRVLAAFNKDPTLTGRTTLWDWADIWISRAPLLGHGYKAFWLGDSNETASVLSMFGQTDGRVFQFHNTFREILVDLGWVGLLAFLAAALVFVYFALMNVMNFPSSTTAFFASMLLLLVARSPFESIVLVFYPYTVLFYACGIASLMPRLKLRHRTPMPRWPSLPNAELTPSVGIQQTR